MEDPRPQLEAALKAAMKNKDNQRRDVIRMSLNALKQETIDSQRELTAEDAVAILQREVKKRRESVEEYRRAGRDDLADTEQAELEILTEFMPRQLSEAEIRAIVSEVIAETGATSARDMGRVMGPVMQRVKGAADGKLVNQIVREQLNA
ncbi:MAG: GatB/YqeY domain-containing protein [Phototrophicaceae bacterium]